MLSLEKRLALFEEKLNSVSAEDLYEELQSYEPSGPLANDFLSLGNFYDSFNTELFGKPHVLCVAYIGGRGEINYSDIENHDNIYNVSCNDEIYAVSVAS